MTLSVEERQARNAYQRDWYHRNSARVLDRQRLIRESRAPKPCKVCGLLLASQRRTYCDGCLSAEAKNGKRKRHLKRKYGMTVEAYDLLLLAQGGCCAICRWTPESDEEVLVVDHDHADGTVRGLLCTSCNWALGHMSDSPARLRLAAEYIEHPPAAEKTVAGVTF